MTTNERHDMSADTASLPVVAIGASAGGVEALEALFTHMPVDTGCAFVVVTHLGPGHRTLLPEILARYTAMPVHLIVGDIPMQANEIYVMPADVVLDMADGALRLRKSTSQRRDRKPIDIFFSSLAKDRGEFAAGIVLSGSDGDGALGVKAIKEHGGLTLAQAPDGGGPRHPDMPISALASGMVDLFIPAPEMGARILEFGRGFGGVEKLADGENQSTYEHKIQSARQEICAILRNQIGHDFSGYKANTFLRRVQRRMQVNRIDDLEA
jgi:two-component system, chemotaxis family, CheB/CheR fusion protein